MNCFNNISPVMSKSSTPQGKKPEKRVSASPVPGLSEKNDLSPKKNIRPKPARTAGGGIFTKKPPW